MKQTKILVAGGSGFLGRAICRQAAREGVAVVSVSRGGKPNEMTVEELPSVTWIAADIFHPEEWEHHIIGCSAVIHSIGIIEEEPEKGITYERMIYEAARVVADTAGKHGVERFVFISAGAAAPETPAGYMQWKEHAEAYLEACGLDIVILKPGMIYGPEHPDTMTEAKQLLAMMQHPLFGDQIRANRPLPVETVANAALRSAVDATHGRKLNVDAIEEMMNTA